LLFLYTAKMMIYSLESSCNIGVKITFFNHQVVSFLRFFFSFFSFLCWGMGWGWGWLLLCMGT
jgi:hypothetical protein